MTARGWSSSIWPSAAFTSPNWAEFEKAICGGWRSQGFHGPKHKLHREEDRGQASDFRRAARPVRPHDRRAYQNSMMVPGNVVLATAYSDPSKPEAPARMNRSSG